MDFFNSVFGGGNQGNRGNRGGPGGGGGYGGGYNMPQQKAQYQDFLNVLPAYAFDKPELENSAKILLPADVLQTISHFTFPVPMLFCITNTYTNKRFYAGVLEFTASPQHCVIPFWMFQQLGCFDGQQVGVSLVTEYKKGKLIRIQPHETAFIDLPNPKAILEHEVPLSYQFLSQDQTIEVQHMGRSYKLNIIKVEPNDDSHTICIVDTDLNIDFAPPLDYIEEPQPLPQITKKTSSQKRREEEEEQQFKVFSGKAVRIDEKPIDQRKLQKEAEERKKNQKEYDPRKYKLKHGLRKTLESEFFAGNATSIGKSNIRR